MLLYIMRYFVVIPCNFCVNPEKIPLIRNQFHGIISGKTWVCKNVKSVGFNTQLLITSNDYHLYRAQKWFLCHRLQPEIPDRYLLWYLPTAYNCYALLIDICVSVLMLHHLQCHSTLVHCYTHCPPSLCSHL